MRQPGSNSFLSLRGARLVRMLAVAACAWMAWSGTAGAVPAPAGLGPIRALAELRHTRWTLGDGAPANIRAIAQGSDGFLWLGSSTGLYRFDGIRFERVDPPEDGRRRSLQVTALLAARNGDLWVGYDYGGIAVVRNGRVRDANPWKPDGGVDTIVEARDGSIWFSADSRGKLFLGRMKDGAWTRIGPGQGYPGGQMGAILAAADGSIYVAQPGPVLRMRPGASRFEALPIRSASSATLAQDPSGGIWLGDDSGLRRIVGTPARLPLGGANTPYVRRGMRFDRSGNLWVIAQDDGLTRFRSGSGSLRPPEHMAAAQGLTSTLSLAVAEDREGNIWIGTESGLDRLSATNIVRAEPNDALVTGFAPAADGSALFIAGLAGIYRIDAGNAAPQRIFDKASIGVLCGDAQRLLTFSLAGNFLLDLERGRVRRVTNIGEPLSVTCALDEKGQFWTGMDRLYRLKDARLVPAEGPAGLPTGTVGKIEPFEKGLVIGRANKGLRLVREGREWPLWRREDQRIGSTTSFRAVGRFLLVGAEAGIGRWDGKQLAQLTARAYPALTGIMGILPTADGQVWVIGSNGILRMARTALDAAFDRPGTPIPMERFGYYEGFTARSNLNVGEGNDIAKDASGRLWFATNKGLAIIDAAGVARNGLVPPVVIHALSSGGRRWAAGSAPIELPAGTDRLEIDYTALSLTDAHANRFRYRLEGVETTWTDAQDRRQALYTNLAPGTYRFRVIAANNDGVWNREGAVLAFRIAPRFYQTQWFLALCIIAGATLLGLLYRRRLAIVAERARAGIQGQLDERERIARELHDTLLQGFQGLMLRFQSVVEQLPPGAPARDTLETALERADDVLMESRERVRALRSTMAPVVLRAGLEAVLARSVPASMQWVLEEQGRVRMLCAPAAEELVAILAEAVSNAARHGEGRRLQVRVDYGARRLILDIVDDGRGIAPEVLAAGGRDGHFGLKGMRERAERLGGTLSIAEGDPLGTRVQVRVPARTGLYADPQG